MNDLKNITEYSVEQYFLWHIDISIDRSFKELLFRAEYVWLWKFLS